MGNGNVLNIILFLTMVYWVLALSISPEEPGIYSRLGVVAQSKGTYDTDVDAESLSHLKYLFELKCWWIFMKKRSCCTQNLNKNQKFNKSLLEMG